MKKAPKQKKILVPNLPKPLSKAFLIFSLGIIVGLGAIAYSNTFNGSFHFDDQFFIIENYAIRNIHNLLGIWQFYPCRFITFLSLALNYHYSGLNVFGYHLFNVAVHLVSALLVWWFVLLTLSTPVLKEERIAQHRASIALFAGLIFVAHPVQTEAVTFIWQRTASLAALFYLAALCLYVQSRLKDRFQIFYYGGAMVATVAAMFTKENTITLPCMILLYEITFLKNERGMNWLYLLPFLFTLLIIPLTMAVTGSQKLVYVQGSVELPGGLTPVQYGLSQFRVMLTYIRLMFLPFNQNLDYDYPIANSFFELPTLVSFLLLMGLLFVAQRLFLKYRLLSFSIIWFFLTSLPEANPFPVKDLIFEHRLYLPLVGYCIFLPAGVYYLLGQKTVVAMTITLSIIIGGYAFLTYQRNEVWRSELTLWDDTVAKSPHKARPINNRGLAYFNQGDTALALADYNAAIELDPGYVEAYNNRGTIFNKEGRYADALSDFNKAIELRPSFAQAYNDRGHSYGELGKYDEAIADFDKALELNPHMTNIYANRGIIYDKMGRYAQALADDDKAIEFNPDNALAYNNRAIVYAMHGDYQKALLDFNKAIALDPNYASAYNNRAKLLEKLK